MASRRKTEHTSELQCDYSHTGIAFNMPDSTAGDFFTLDGLVYPYYPIGAFGENRVEVPFALSLLGDTAPDRYIEVGHLLHRFKKRDGHIVIDKYERDLGYSNLYDVDIVDFVTDKQFSACVCISTLEHIGYAAPEELDPKKILHALEVMRGMVAPGGFLVVTVPLNFNRFLKQYLKDGTISFDKMLYMRQIELDKWVECTFVEIEYLKYASPFPGASGLVIGVDYF